MEVGVELELEVGNGVLDSSGSFLIILKVFGKGWLLTDLGYRRPRITRLMPRREELVGLSVGVGGDTY